MRRRRKGKTRLAAAVAMAVLALLAGAAWFIVQISMPYQGYSSGEVILDIPRGTSVGDIARLLADSGVVRSRTAFEWYTRWKGEKSLKAGEYQFNQPMSVIAVYDKMAHGRVYTLSVTVPEGLNLFDIAALMEREGFSSREEFLAAARDASLVRDIAPEAKSLEGFLFPAKYEFPRNASARAITEAMVRQFRQVWSRMPQQAIMAGGRSVHELVTLASLVEKESSLRDERPLISAVFYNRLRKRMALQCDPTVIYALILAGTWKGDLTYANLRTASPYNTYVYAGLPPGPIANPGESSLRAALEPANSDYLYFVADTTGGHVFSRTLAEHNRNVRDYVRKRAAANRKNAGAGKKP